MNSGTDYNLTNASGQQTSLGWRTLDLGLDSFQVAGGPIITDTITGDPTLTIQNDVTFEDNVQIDGTLTVSQETIFDGTVEFNNSIQVDNTATFNNTVEFNSTTQFDATSTFNAETTFNSDLNLTTNVDMNMDATSTLYAQTITSIATAITPMVISNVLSNVGVMVTNAGLVTVGAVGVVPAPLLPTTGVLIPFSGDLGITLGDSSNSDPTTIYGDTITIDGDQTVINEYTTFSNPTDVTRTVQIGDTTTGKNTQVTIQAEEDVVLYLEADTDNVTETDNPRIVMSQDGGAVASSISMNSNDMVFQSGYSGTSDSQYKFYVDSTVTDNGPGNPPTFATGDLAFNITELGAISFDVTGVDIDVDGDINNARSLDMTTNVSNPGGANTIWQDTGGDLYIGAAKVGTGDVVGPASATDNAIARYDATTGKLIQDSTPTITDTGSIQNIQALDLTTAATNPNGANTLWQRTSDGHLFRGAVDLEGVNALSSNTDRALCCWTGTSGSDITEATGITVNVGNDIIFGPGTGAGIELSTTGGTPSCLCFYEEYSATHDVDASGSVFSVSTWTITLTLTRVGNICTVYIPAINHTASSSSGSYYIIEALPTRFRPAGDDISQVIHTNNSAQSGDRISVAFIRSDGVIRCYAQTNTSTSYPNTGTVGHSSWSASWVV